MRRIAIMLIAVTSLVAWVSPASAAAGREGARAYSSILASSGTFSGQGTWDVGPGGPVCDYVVDINGRLQPDRRSGPGGGYAIHLCISLNGLEGTGTFIMATDRDVMLGGTVFLPGNLPNDGPGLELDLTLTVTGSAGARRPIRGTIRLLGTSVETGNDSVEQGTFTSTLRYT